jgi:hypothetical protein
MAAPTFDRDRALRVLVDAFDLGDATACQRHGISVRTLERYRVRLKGDPQLSEAVAQKKEELERDWRQARRRALRSGITKLEQLIQAAEVKQLRDVAGAVKILGDLEVVAGVLDDEQQSGANSEGSKPSPPQGNPSGPAPVH